MYAFQHNRRAQPELRIVKPEPKPESKPGPRKVLKFFTREQFLLAVAVIALTLALAPAPVAHAGTFEINMDGLMDTAADIFNGLWPAFAIVAGLTLGFIILKFVLSAIKGATGGG